MVRLSICLLAMVGIFGTGQSLLALETGALDGQWCSGDNRSIKIVGTAVVAANGLATTGTYSQNAFYFTEPRADGRAGPQIWMEPKGPDAVRVSVLSAVQKEPPPHDLWRRCLATTFKPSASVTLL